MSGTAHRTSAFSRLRSSREAATALTLVVLLAVTVAVSPHFLFSDVGRANLLQSFAILGMLAVGQAMVIITRNVDISVGAIVGLTAYVAGKIVIAQPHLSIALVIGACAVAGAILGLVNGLLVGFGKVPALVITLGTMYVYRGVLQLWTSGGQVTASNLSHDFLQFGTAQVLGIPVLCYITLIVLVLGAFITTSMRFGRDLYAIGSAPDAAVLYGLPTRARVTIVFVISGMLAGIAGCMYAALYGTADASVGTGMELQSIAAAVVGGVAVFGGSGSIVGAGIGAALLVTLNQALPTLGVSSFWQQAVDGALIVGAVTVDLFHQRRRRRRLLSKDVVSIRQVKKEMAA
ncbi:ABC transporter permease [Microbacterium sp. X-17]|uniref:ABC transporter permease n=1 Tax=Microbacterium sp. X-17 TaxID=3144404 RepID=UPI0031F5AB23